MINKIKIFTALVALTFSNNVLAAACPQIVKPVCAADPTTKQVQTYTNSCFAQHASAIVLHDGKCNGLMCPRSCIVHGVRGKSIITGAIKVYDNMCWAEKDLAKFISYAPCPR
ncbi:hypothetical protein DYH55_09100 [Methylovirgula sp. 4M-Z18]|nr:hypothetical protein DYH55_09100 [Methylovirgula sp. 4M-Z18]